MRWDTEWLVAIRDPHRESDEMERNVLYMLTHARAPHHRDSMAGHQTLCR